MPKTNALQIDLSDLSLSQHHEIAKRLATTFVTAFKPGMFRKAGYEKTQITAFDDAGRAMTMKKTHVAPSDGRRTWAREAKRFWVGMTGLLREEDEALANYLEKCWSVLNSPHVDTRMKSLANSDDGKSWWNGPAKSWL